MGRLPLAAPGDDNADEDDGGPSAKPLGVAARASFRFSEVCASRKTVRESARGLRLRDAFDAKGSYERIARTVVVRSSIAGRALGCIGTFTGAFRTLHVSAGSIEHGACSRSGSPLLHQSV